MTGSKNINVLFAKKFGGRIIRIHPFTENGKLIKDCTIDARIIGSCVNFLEYEDAGIIIGPLIHDELSFSNHERATFILKTFNFKGPHEHGFNCNYDLTGITPIYYDYINIEKDRQGMIAIEECDFDIACVIKSGDIRYLEKMLRQIKLKMNAHKKAD